MNRTLTIGHSNPAHAERGKSIVSGQRLLPVVVLAAALTLRFAGAELANLSYVSVALYALLGRRQAIQALAMSWLFTMLNPGIAPNPTAGSVCRYLVLAAAGLSTLARSDLAKGKFRVNTLVFATILLGLLVVLHAVLFSPLPGVSILKAASWTVAVSTLLAAFGGLTGREHARCGAQIFGGLIVALVVSLPLLVTSVGYLRNGTGFQGIFKHPQVFGVTMALLAAWLLGELIVSSPPSWRSLLLLGATLMLVVLSEARTAGLSLLVGALVGIPFSVMNSPVSARRLLRGLRSKRMHLVAFVGGAGLILAGPLITHRLHSYIQKRSNGGSVIDVYSQSRGGLMSDMLANIEQHPFSGIGFGIASDPTSMVVDRDPLFGVPVSASVEKGVMPLAILEELGIPGVLLVAGWLLLLVRSGLRGGLTPSVVICTALLTNMGESTLFSPGGMGLLILMLVCWASTSCQRASLPGGRVVVPSGAGHRLS